MIGHSLISLPTLERNAMYRTKLCIITLGALFVLPAAAADESTSLLKENGIEVGGWINAGITYNTNNPANRFNGPVTFADRSNEFQVNQLNLFMERAVATEGKAWDFRRSCRFHGRY